MDAAIGRQVACEVSGTIAGHSIPVFSSLVLASRLSSSVVLETNLAKTMIPEQMDAFMQALTIPY